MSYKYVVSVICFFVVFLLHGGCTRYIVRDTVTYQTELNQYDAWAVQQAALLKGFMAETCTCDTKQVFTTQECRDAADFVMTIEARSEWHKAMSLYLAGINGERPPREPPAIPPSSTLCPAIEGDE